MSAAIGRSGGCNLAGNGAGRTHTNLPPTTYTVAVREWRARERNGGHP